MTVNPKQMSKTLFLLGWCTHSAILGPLTKTKRNIPIVVCLVGLVRYAVGHLLAKMLLVINASTLF